MSSQPTTNAFSEQGSLHYRNNIGIVTETATNRARITSRAQKKRQEPIEPRQETYGSLLPSQSQSLVNIIQVEDNENFDTSPRAESTTTRIRTPRRNKRTQDAAELDEPESSNSHGIASRPISRAKRRATRTEGGVFRNEQEACPIIILPPPYRSDSPHPTNRQIAELDITHDSSYLRPLNSTTTGNNTGGVTLPPISLPQENGGITLPSIGSVLFGERSRTPEISNEIEVVDLSSPPPSNNADPYPNNVIDLTSSPVTNTYSPAVNSPHIGSNILTREVIVIDDDSSVEDPSSAGSPLPPRGLQLKCAICLDHPKDVSFTSCGHIFCRECITTALKSQKACSLCRRPLTKKNIKRLEFKILQ